MSNFKAGDFSLPHGVGTAIGRGITLIAAHPSVDKILSIHPERDNSVEVTVAVRLGLPNQWMAKGVSPNGVLAVEPVTFSFGQSFPIHAPTVKLRADFDRSLAHVQPGFYEGYVLPCLYDGDLDELMQVQGLWAIVEQMVAWLEKAALNELIDPNQGWEPIRRDTLEDIVIADSDYLRNLAFRKERYVFLPFSYWKIEKSESLESTFRQYSIYGQVESRSLKLPNFSQIFAENQNGSRSFNGRSVALIVLPDKLSTGELCVADSYLPEDVTDIASLRQRAKEFGCVKNLEIALSSLQWRERNSNFEGAKFPVAIVLCVRRPFPLIGETSEIELIPYIVKIAAPRMLTDGERTPVFPAVHRHAIAPKLLQEFSGEQPVPAGRDLVLVGCGSLGSKIAMHMARSGAAPSIAIDKNWLSPHNAARHALLPRTGATNSWFGSKAKDLAQAIKVLGQSCEAFDLDVTQIAQSSSLLKKVFPRNTWAIINSTASVVVRETLASIAPKKLYPRVIETSLFANGKVGLVAVEGPGRNPNSVDLIAEAYEAMREDPRFRSAVFEGEDPTQHRSVGQGCSSTTMIISDAKISMLAAAMTQGITKMRTKGLPDSGGRILLGAVTDDEMGLNWKTIDVPPVQIIPVDGNAPWTVRIGDRAHQKILKDCAEHPLVETGGILVGRISQIQQAFIVTNVLPAPQDSSCSKFEFVLGTSSVKNLLEQYASSCNYALYCLGTWHSHLNNSGPSERDLQTAMEMANSRIAPFVLLIRTPVSYRAVSTTNF